MDSSNGMNLAFRLSMAVVFFPIVAGALLHLAGRLLAPPEKGQAGSGDPTGRMVALAACLLVLLASFILAGTVMHHGAFPAFKLGWVLTSPSPELAVPGAAIGFNLLVDNLSAIVILIFGALVTVAVLYSFKYFDDGGSADYYALMLIFLGGMNGVALANDVIQFYFFWELMLVPSWLLVTFWSEEKDVRAASLKYFIFTHVGAVLMLVGLFLAAVWAGTTDMSLIQAKLAEMSRLGRISPAILVAIAWLVSAGFLFKMAIVPFHSWLPDAYVAAPMPVTVTLAAAMINTGVYGLVRFLFNVVPLEVSAALGFPFLVLAVVSMYYGGLMALAEREIKRMVAYSSISQMGYMLFGVGATLCLVGAGRAAAGMGVAGTIFHMINHGIGKAMLFLVVGAVALSTGARRFGETGGLARHHPALAFWASVGALTLVGAPPLAGFTSEWMIFAGGFGTAHTTLALVACAGTLLTTGYCLWFVKRVFFGETLRGAPSPLRIPGGWHVALGTLAGVSLAIGVVPAPFFALVKGAVAGSLKLLLL